MYSAPLRIDTDPSGWYTLSASAWVLGAPHGRYIYSKTCISVRAFVVGPAYVVLRSLSMVVFLFLSSGMLSFAASASIAALLTGG